jgi:hypothetical protein
LRVEAAGLRGQGRILATIDIHHEGAVWPEPVALVDRGDGRFDGVMFAGGSARAVSLRAFGRLVGTASTLRVRRIGPWDAARRLLSRPGSIGMLARTRGRLKGRLREAQAAIIARAPDGYADWIAVFGTWGAEDFGEDPGGPEIRVLEPGQGQDWRKLGVGPGAYVGLLATGEVLAPLAVEIARRELPGLGLPAIAMADWDRIDANGVRSDPFFGPEPNHALMLSGVLARGLWLVRADVLGRWGGRFDEARPADMVRLELWLWCWRSGLDPGRRLPFVLSSLPVEAPPPDAHAVIEAHLRAARLPFRAVPGWPVRLRANGAAPGAATAIIPSTLRSALTERCIGAILAMPELAVIVAVSQAGPLDPVQQAMAKRLRALSPALRVETIEAASFNFAHTVNRAAAWAGEGPILLLNDDVEPRDDDWFATMLAHLAVPNVGIVGARLLYPDGTIQHGGVVMGLAGFCEHAFRGLPGEIPGPEWRAQLPQRLTAVTGACLLIDGALWRMLGGMDEFYPSAYNDIDLCLRAGEAGREVVLSDATLIHHELQTYGGHFAGERASFEAAETARMRARWAHVIACDPFYNPNLDTWPGREWKPAFPPRLGTEGAPS